MSLRKEEKMNIKLKDGSEKIYQQPMSIYDIALDISEGLARMACAGVVNGEIKDLRTVLNQDCQLNIVTAKDPEGLRALRHTASHVMAEAVMIVRPNAKVAIGPAIENGFYYDFETEPFTREDLDEIEKEMKKIIKKGDRVNYSTMPRLEAIEMMKQKQEPYKVELIQDLPEDSVISFYEQGGFMDLCAGPHLMNTKPIKAFKLTSSSGAYWRGSEKNKMLTRIYGTAFGTKDELEAYLEYLENIKKRDHNKVGREMELFTTVDVIGQGLPLLMPKGAKIIQTLQRWIEDEEERRGYVRTKTPMMAKKELYEISGHWQHYRDGMFVLGDPEGDGEVFALRPMTCPFQYFIYKAGQHSYRDLPIRYGETSTLFRNEESGEMHGLTRVRQFTISEGHVITTPEQVNEEFKACIELALYCLKTLGLEDDVTFRLSKWDPNNREKYIGDAATWESSQDTMREMLKEMKLPFEEADGEAAFYGPKLDIQAKNVYGKEDTMITVQLDFALSEQYDMYYVDKNGDKKRPYIIHRTSIGCYERTLAWLIEKYEGNLPTWLCPEQVRVLPISEKYEVYANKVCEELKNNNILATVDHRSEKIGYKIRDSRMNRVPYMLVVGQKEEEDGTVSVRSRYDGDEGAKDFELFLTDLTTEIRTRKIKIIQPEVTKEGAK